MTQTGSQVFRVVRDDAASDLREFLASPSGRGLIAGGELVGSQLANAADKQWILEQNSERVSGWAGATVLEHVPVSFVSYPYEWPRAMLREAARVTVEVAERLLEDGYGLKDATPFNVLFEGPNAIFIDALSIEKRDPGDPIWRPMAQFLQTFLYPLLLEDATRASVHETFLGRREGLSPRELYQRLSWLQRLQPKHLRWSSLPLGWGAAK